MQRVKLALVASLAVAAMIALSGCSDNPRQAASMSGFSLTDDQVEQSAKTIEANFDKLRGQLRQQGQDVPEDPIRGQALQAVVQLTTFNELARRYAQEKGVSVPAPDIASQASRSGLPQDDPYVKLVAQTQAYVSALTAAATPADPTDADLADLRRAYDALAAQSGRPGTMTDADLRALLKDPEVRMALGLRNDLRARAERYGLVVNPRYAPVSVGLTGVQTDLGGVVVASLPLGDQGTGAVRDAA